jgi:hypothetical protein
VPLPEVASTIASGAPPLSARRGDLSRRLLAAIDAALSVDPAKRPPAARLATELRDALSGAPARATGRAAPRRSRPAKRIRPSSPPVPLKPRLIPAGAAAVATLLGGSLLPFWPSPLLVLLAVTAGLASLRAPRVGLAVALAAPIFPLGNVAQAAAVVYGALALAWLAVSWRDARAGLAFLAGPVLAAFGLIALLPLAVQPARGVWRRALQAAIGVYVAAAVAALSGRDLPLGAGAVHDLGVAQSEDPVAVLDALGTVLRDHPQISTTALAFAITAALLPRARARGHAGIAGLGALQLVLVLLWGPSIPWPPLVLGTLLLCLLLEAAPFLREFVRGRGR